MTPYSLIRASVALCSTLIQEMGFVKHTISYATWCAHHSRKVVLFCHINTILSPGRHQCKLHPIHCISHLQPVHYVHSVPIHYWLQWIFSHRAFKYDYKIADFQNRVGTEYRRDGDLHSSPSDSRCCSFFLHWHTCSSTWQTWRSVSGVLVQETLETVKNSESTGLEPRHPAASPISETNMT